jgi:methyl-accepting chemotaxis protein
MADDISKTINIDIEIKNDGQQQVQQYKAAFDNLRTVVNNLNSPLRDLSKQINSLDKDLTNLSSSINKVNTSSSSTSSWASKIVSSVGSVEGSFKGLQKIFQIFDITFGEFTAGITGGLSLLISFLPLLVRACRAFKHEGIFMPIGMINES